MSIALGVVTHLNRAGHERRPLVCLEKHFEHVRGRLVQFVHLSDASGEILHGLAGAAPFERFVGPMKPEGNTKAIP